MTDFTLSSGSICRPHRSPWGAFPVRSFGVSTGVSSAAIWMGSVVTLDYTEAGNSSVNMYIKRSTAINHFYATGVAAETQPNGGSGSSAVIGTPCEVWECNPLVEFKAATIGGTLQSSQVGLTKKLMWDSTLNIQVVDLGASTNSDHRVVITDLIDQQGDSGGYVAFRFLTDAAFQGSSGSLSSTPYLAFYRR